MQSISELFTNIKGGLAAWVAAGEQFVAQLIVREKAVVQKEDELVARESELTARSEELEAREVAIAEREQKILALSASADEITRAMLSLRSELKSVIPAGLKFALLPESATAHSGIALVVQSEGPHSPVIEEAGAAAAPKPEPAATGEAAPKTDEKAAGDEPAAGDEIQPTIDAAAEPAVKVVSEVAEKANAPGEADAEPELQPIPEVAAVVGAESVPIIATANLQLPEELVEGMPIYEEEKAEAGAPGVAIPDAVAVAGAPAAEAEPQTGAPDETAGITNIPTELLKDLARVYASGDLDLIEECATRVSTAASLLDETVEHAEAVHA